MVITRSKFLSGFPVVVHLVHLGRWVVEARLRVEVVEAVRLLKGYSCRLEYCPLSLRLGDHNLQMHLSERQKRSELMILQEQKLRSRICNSMEGLQLQFDPRLSKFGNNSLQILRFWFLSFWELPHWTSSSLLQKYLSRFLDLRNASQTSRLLILRFFSFVHQKPSLSNQDHSKCLLVSIDKNFSSLRLLFRALYVLCRFPNGRCIAKGQFSIFLTTL